MNYLLNNQQMVDFIMNGYMVIKPTFRPGFHETVLSKLDALNIRYLYDDRPKMSPGFKFNEWEMKGVPIRIEVGQRDLSKRNITLVRRDTSEKIIDQIKSITPKISNILQQIQDVLFQEAFKFQETNTYQVTDYEEFKTLINKGAFIDCGWDGNPDSENAIKSIFSLPVSSSIILTCTISPEFLTVVYVELAF